MSETTPPPPAMPALGRDSEVIYIADDHQFQIVVDDVAYDISPFDAVCFVLQLRYIATSDLVAEKTREMQEQINQIHEANSWLNAVTTGASGMPFEAPEGATETLQEWMESNGIDSTGYEDPPSKENLEHAQGQISNYVDQLSSNNDLRMLSLKTAVNKSQQALTAADGVLQNLKQLMQTIIANLTR